MKDGSKTPRYRVLRTVVLTTDRQIYLPGSIVDLSHLPPESRRWFVQNGFYETADGEPENEPDPLPTTGRAKPCNKNC